MRQPKKQYNPGMCFTKDPKTFPLVNALEKFLKTVSGVSQNSRGFPAPKKSVVFPKNFTGDHMLPRKVKKSLAKVY